ncbi:MAG: potassium channel protein [Gammaproteobacteria bacterium]|nr:MAG: potassium channel protein [Gammaproteobacteria bacterium]
MISLLRRRPLRGTQTEGRMLHHALWRSLGLLVLLVSLHTLIIWQVEPLGLADALWLTLSTITTVGYGDVVAHTLPGRLATVGLLYIGGIFLLAKTAGDYFDYRRIQQILQQRGLWSWPMQDHILILNTPIKNGELYLQRLTSQIRASEQLGNLPIQILTRAFPEGLPNILCKECDNVVHYHGQPENPADLDATHARQARIIIILAKDEYNPDSDGRTFDILHRLRELGTHATKLVECVEDRNRQRLKNAGADIIIRPMRSYPEMLVRALAAPGSELIMQNMFTSSGDLYQRYEITLRDKKWEDVVRAILSADYGLAVAYTDLESGSLVCNPPAKSNISASALYVMVREEQCPTAEQIGRILAT